MSPTARKNYIKDRTQVAETYIMEYNNTRLWKLEDIIPPENLNQRLQIVFGRVDATGTAIDYALEKDNEIRRKTNLRYLEAPTRFPTPDTMQAHEPTQWITWIQKETQKLIEALNEEIRMLNDKDDPFSTAGQQFQRETGEIPSVETLATPLIPEKVNNPCHSHRERSHRVRKEPARSRQSTHRIRFKGNLPHITPNQQNGR